MTVVSHLPPICTIQHKDSVCYAQKVLNKYVLEDCMNEFNNFHMYCKHDNFYKNKEKDYINLDCQRIQSS